MQKRRLSKRQSERIRKKQREKIRTLDRHPEQADGQRGQVIGHHGKTVEVEYYDEQHQRQHISCHLRANLESVVTGDYVVWQQEDSLGVVVSVEERETVLQRPDAFGHLRPIAANITQLILVIAPEPEAFHGLIDRYLVAAENLELKTLILVNKSDLLEKQAWPSLETLVEDYRKIGYDIQLISARSGEGFNELQTKLDRETSIFVGQSGVGKSSIIQTMLPDEDLRIGELSAAAAKGKHTTTHSHLYHFSSGGVCIDSPGIREFGLWHLSADDVLNGFVDLREQALYCKFRNCEHKAEPGCGITRALEEGKLYKWRVDSYKHILNTLNDVTIKSSQ